MTDISHPPPSSPPYILLFTCLEINERSETNPPPTNFQHPPCYRFNYSIRFGIRRKGEGRGRDPYAVGTRDVTSRVITETWILYFHQRYHAATMTPARKSGEGEKRRGVERDALIDCTFAVTVTGTLLFCTYALARVPLSLQARNPALRRLQGV